MAPAGAGGRGDQVRSRRVLPVKHRPGSWRAWITRLSPLLCVAVGIALALRLTMVFVVHPLCPFDPDQWATKTGGNLGRSATASPNCLEMKGDATYLYVQGRAVADGLGFLYPPTFMDDGTIVAGAGKPPMMTLTVAALARVGLVSPDALRVVQALAGATTVAFVGLLARRLAGRRAGDVAALCAAVYPILWINDWRMLNESFLALASVLVFFAAFRLWERPNIKTSIILAASIVFAGFCRVESYLLFAVLAVPLVLLCTRRIGLGHRLKLISVMALTAAVLMAPWALYNYSRFANPVTVSAGSGSAHLNGSCDEAWFGDQLGYLSFTCFDPLLVARADQLASGALGRHADESESSVVYQEAADAYIARNLPRYPIVIAARVGRLWDLYRPLQNVQFNAELEERGRADSMLGFLTYAVLVPFGVFGLVVLRRARIPILPFLAVALVASVAAAMTFGLTRYRVMADVALCITAAVGSITAMRMWSKSDSASGSRATDHLAETHRRGGWRGRLDHAIPEPGSVTIERAANAEPPRLWLSMPVKARRAVLLIGVVVIVLTGVAVGWSSTVEPSAAAADGARAVCVDARRAIGEFLTSSSAPPTPEKLAIIRSSLQRLAAGAPETVQWTTPILSFVDGLERSGKSLIAYQASLPPSEAIALQQAGDHLNAYLQKACT